MLTIHQKLGSIRIVRMIARGGMGEVYLGYHEALNIPVAIKTSHFDDKRLIQQFAVEARALAKLAHPNIVRVLDFNTDYDPPYIVQEYVDGKTLTEYVDERGKLDPQEAIRVVLEIAQALRAAHQIGIIHRDVKPQNIFFTKNGSIKLGDFGLAVLQEESGLKGEEVHGYTPSYAPLEQVLGESVDHRADIYSLGITFYQLLVGDIPQGVQIRENAELLMPSSVPEYIKPILVGMTRLKALDRFQTMDDVIDALRLICDPMLGLSIKNYRLIRGIGRGGQGKVYLAEGSTGPVAVKILLTDEGIKPEARDRFRLEGKVSKYLDHQNIVKVHEYGEAVLTIQEETKTLHFIIMDFIKGMDLEDLMTHRQEPNIDESVQVICEILSALDYAHNEGLIHRDVKARNVMISNEGRVKLTDFGLCKYNAEYNPQTSFSFSALTDSGTILGSPHFMSPEQITAPKEIERTTDIYSCGVLLFYLCTHQLPFTGTTVMTILLNILSEPTPDPRKLNSKISDKLSKIIIKMLDKDPVQRFQSCREAREDLLSYLPEAGSIQVDLAQEVLEHRAELPELSTPTVFALIGAEKKQVTTQLGFIEIEDVEIPSGHQQETRLRE